MLFEERRKKECKNFFSFLSFSLSSAGGRGNRGGWQRRRRVGMAATPLMSSSNQIRKKTYFTKIMSKSEYHKKLQWICGEDIERSRAKFEAIPNRKGRRRRRRRRMGIVEIGKSIPRKVGERTNEPPTEREWNKNYRFLSFPLRNLITLKSTNMVQQKQKVQWSQIFLISF